MKLFIPELGTKLELTKNWKLNVQWEYRNLTLIKFLVKNYLTKTKNLKKKNQDVDF